MNKSKGYPSYRDSGDAWLGEIPSHWSVSRGSGFLFEKKRKNENLKSENYLSLMAGRGVIPYAEKGDVGNKKPDDLTKCKLVEVGDFVINSMNFSIGSYGVSKHDGICSPVYVVMTHNPNVVAPEFVDLILSNSSYQNYAQSFGTGILDHRRSIGWEEIKRIPLAIPPIEEQVKIAAYTHRETARIDTLIAKKTRFIELLKEKRQAAITKAVTKGLDDSVEMKDSGVEWVGRMPEHWEIGRLDGASKIVRGNSEFSKGDLLENGQYVALQYGRTYKANEINDSFVSYVNQEFFKSSQVAEIEDTILISTSETLEDLGHSCFYNRQDVGLIGGEQFLLKPNKEKTVGKYLYFASKVFSRYLQKYATGLKVFRFGSDDLKAVYLPKLSQDEQQKIVDFLDRETLRIDILISKTERSIELLKEKRSALITAAVTGKIDVREAA